MKLRSLSVNGRSTDVRNNTRSARGTKMGGQFLMLADDRIGSGVSTIVISVRKPTGR